MCCRRETGGWASIIDFAIFADTQEEPAAVYRHLDWLMTQQGPPILVRTAGRLGDDLIHGRPGSKRFASIPAYVRVPGQEREGMVRRQCTQDYKIEVCTKTIRYELLGLKPRQRAPKGTMVNQFFGISLDERQRAERAKTRFAKLKWTTPHYPLIDMGWSRRDCLAYLRERVPHEVPKNSCTFCPFKTNQAWAEMKANDPKGWARAVEIDEAIRRPGAVCGRQLEGQLYLHRSLVPLQMIDFDALKPTTLDPLITGECTGMCGL
jgi:hypothetical protein